LASNEVFGPYQLSVAGGLDASVGGTRLATYYSVWIFGPQDDTLPSLFAICDGDQLIRATRRVVIASTEMPARLVVTWGSDDTPALMYEGVYRCPETLQPRVLRELRAIFDIRPTLDRGAGTQALAEMLDDEFRERVLTAITVAVRATGSFSQKAVARTLGTNETTLREECDFRSRRNPQLRWSAAKVDALARVS
jgi:hypothetical protein